VHIRKNIPREQAAEQEQVFAARAKATRAREMKTINLRANDVPGAGSFLATVCFNYLARQAVPSRLCLITVRFLRALMKLSLRFPRSIVSFSRRKGETGACTMFTLRFWCSPDNGRTWKIICEGKSFLSALRARNASERSTMKLN
jgi:hypothetical protein